MNKLTALVRIVLSAAIFLVAASQCTHESEISRSISEHIRQQNMTTLRLTDVTDFEWDQVYFFHPYTPRARVCEALEIQKQDCERLVPVESVDDGLMSIAFMADGHLVRYAMHARYDGDFTSVAAERPIAAKAAIFMVVEDDRPNYAAGPWLRLKSR